MNQRMLGNGQRVSEIGLGCMGMDHAYGKPAPRADMVALLHRAVELGCTFFDTAVVYGTANEEVLGTAVASMRDQVVLSISPPKKKPRHGDAVARGKRVLEK